MNHASPELPADPARPSAHTRAPRPDWAAHAAVGLILALWAATIFLISPPRGQTYPGAIPWSPDSLLRPITELMSLGGLVSTARGVEIKTLAFHVAVVLALLLAAAWAWRGGPGRALPEPGASRAVTWAQLLLVGWVAMSLASGAWSADADLARGQAVLYGVGVLWAVAVSRLICACRVTGVVVGLTTLTALGGGLCIWYYLERNPFHRPGFPLGNPALLGAAMLTGILPAFGLVAAWLTAPRAERSRASAVCAVLGTAALVPLVGCLWLTGARAAWLALLAGGAVAVLVLVGRRMRLVLAGAAVALLLLTGTLLYQYSHLDLTMARGASTRFRVYAWRYAAELWQTRPFTGCGAGIYPRVAGEMTATDRALDPAAFMSEIVEHAHNELFEVFAEIGLVGGVTFVGGLVATAVAVLRRFSRRGPAPDTALALAPPVVLAALVADALVGVNPRLPGGAALLFTMLGLTWSVCRERSAGAATVDEVVDPVAAEPHRRSPLVALACLMAAASVGYFAYRDWAGVRAEYGAQRAVARGDHGEALAASQTAAEHLLDPVRRIATAQTSLRARAGLAQAALESLGEAEASNAAATRQRAVHLCEAAYGASIAMRQAVPALERTSALAAHAAEWLAELHRPTDAATAAEWRLRAEVSWRQQRRRTPYDVETLLALLRYRATLPTHVAYLRDALREGQTDQEWYRALARLSQAPDFERALANLLAAVGPLTPETDRDTLMLSAAPEAFRLAAAYQAGRGQYDTAIAGAARAAALYEPLRSRIPERVSVALAEQADYVLRRSLADTPEAVRLLELALSKLPAIQEQKFEDLARPFRQRLVRVLLVAGREDDARVVQEAATHDREHVDEALATAYIDLVISFARRETEAERVRAWLASALRLAPDNLLAWSWQAWVEARDGDIDAVQATLDAAQRAGLPPRSLEIIRRSLCREFPPLCAELGHDAPP